MVPFSDPWRPMKVCTNQNAFFLHADFRRFIPSTKPKQHSLGNISCLWYGFDQGHAHAFFIPFLHISFPFFRLYKRHASKWPGILKWLPILAYPRWPQTYSISCKVYHHFVNCQYQTHTPLHEKHHKKAIISKSLSSFSIFQHCSSSPCFFWMVPLVILPLSEPWKWPNSKGKSVAFP